MEDQVARYATALLEIATAEGDLERVVSELSVIGQAIEAESELRHTLTDPRLPAERKRTILERILGGRASPTTVDLVGLVIERGRGGELPAIAASLRAATAVGRGRQLAEVRSAVPLEEHQIRRLEISLSRMVDGAVEVQVTVDPSLLGGMVTRIGDTVIDGTLRRQLANLREALS